MKTVSVIFQSKGHVFWTLKCSKCLQVRNLIWHPKCVEIATLIPKSIYRCTLCQPLRMVWLTQAAAAGALLG